MMMDGDNSWGLWWLFAPLMIVCMVMMIRMMMGHGHASHGGHSSGASGTSEERAGGAERILAERLARGEIDVDEYERRLSVLERATDVPRL